MAPVLEYISFSYMKVLSTSHIDTQTNQPFKTYLFLSLLSGLS